LLAYLPTASVGIRACFLLFFRERDSTMGAEFDGLTATIKVLADQMAAMTAKVDGSISNK